MLPRLETRARVKVIGVENLDQTSHFLTPVIFRGGVDEMSAKPDKIFWRGAWEFRLWLSKTYQQNIYRGLSTYVGRSEKISVSMYGTNAKFKSNRVKFPRCTIYKASFCWTIASFMAQQSGYSQLRLPLSCSGVTRVVTPKAASEGITPLFFPEKTWPPFLVASSAVSPLISSSQKLTTFFAHHFIAFYWFHSGVTPSRVPLHTFFTCPTSFLHHSL